MKLHLPSRLRNAILACMTAVAGIATTCATGTFVAGALAVSQAYAASLYWDSTQHNEHANDVTLISGNTENSQYDRLVVANGSNTNQPANNSWLEGEKYRYSFSVGELTVENGGQLYIHIHTDKNTQKGIGGPITLKGDVLTREELEEKMAEGGDYFDLNEGNTQLFIRDGAYSFGGPITIDGFVATTSQWSASHNFTNLTSASDDAVFLIDPMNSEGRNVVYTLGYNTNLPGGSYNGTIWLRESWSKASPKVPDKELTLNITSQNTIGGNVRFVLEGFSSLRLGSGALYVNSVESLSSSAVIHNKVGGVQVRQTIGNIRVDDPMSFVWLYSHSGSTRWYINQLHGSGYVAMEHEAESYRPDVVYLTGDNRTRVNENGEKEGFNGTFYVSNDIPHIEVMPTAQYGIYQNYVEIRHSHALTEAELSFSPTDSEEMCLLALNVTDAYVGKLHGTYSSLVFSGEAPTTGTEAEPANDIRPTSNAATAKLHVGATLGLGDSSTFYGKVLKNVDIEKEGEGKQVIATLEDDPNRFVYVSQGELEIGSIGEFRRLVVQNGAKAEVGLGSSSIASAWGMQGEFKYYEILGNGVDLSDTTKIAGNVVFTDRLYDRYQEVRSIDATIVVNYLDSSTYAGDTITLVGSDLAVFNPLTGQAANLSGIKKITLDSGGGLISADPAHHNLISDPKITVDADIAIDTSGYITTHGELYESAETGEYTFSALETTYTGSITHAFTENGTYASAYLYKQGFGTAILAGDMSDFTGSVTVESGTLVLSGSKAPIKNMRALYIRPDTVLGKAILKVTDDACMTTEVLRFSGARRVLDECGMTIDKGSTVNVTGVNLDLEEPPMNVVESYSAANFLFSSQNSTHINVDGTLNFLRLSNLSVVNNVAYAKELNVNDGGVLNMMGMWLQTRDSGQGSYVTVNINGGATFNVGADGIGHVDRGDKQVLKGDGDQSLILNIKDGATLGILNDVDSWSTQRDLKLQGNVTVNTQGWIVDEASSKNGVAREISLVSTSGSIEKVGTGTLFLGSPTHLEKVVVKDGYLAVDKKSGNYSVSLDTISTVGSGSLLFDLTDAVPVGSEVADNQEFVKVLKTDGTLNITVEGGENGSKYAILQGGGTPGADKVNLVAMLEDGYTANYSTENYYGYVSITRCEKVGASDNLIWNVQDDSDMWANSTETNFLEDGEAHRFVQNSGVTFTGQGETVSVYGTVLINNMNIDGEGYKFTGSGIISTGANTEGKLVIDGVKTTFATTGQLYFGSGVELLNGATLRIETLTDTSWSGLIAGDGDLEIAAGGVRTNVLTNIMGESLHGVLFDGKTTIKLSSTNTEEADKLRAVEKLVIKSGSRLAIDQTRSAEIMTAGSTLELAGAGCFGDESGMDSALSMTGSATATVLADVVLNDDTTIYAGGGTSLVLAASYTSNGHKLTLKGASGSVTLKQIESKQDQCGEFELNGANIWFDLNDVKMGEEGATPSAVYNPISMEGVMAGIGVNGYTSIESGLNITSPSASLLDNGAYGLVFNSEVTGDESVSISLSNNYTTPEQAVVELNTANPNFEGTWLIYESRTLRANDTNSLVNAKIQGGYSEYGKSLLELGADADIYNIAGLAGRLKVVSEDGEAATLVIHGTDVYTTSSMLDTNINLIKTGKGAQRFNYGTNFADDYAGKVTVREGLLEFYTAPTTYGTFEIAGDDAELRFGSYDNLGEFIAGELAVTTGQTLLISETGATLNANLAPHAGGRITLGAELNSSEGGAWDSNGSAGLKMLGQKLTLNTNDKAKLTVNLSAFLEEGDYVELFNEVGKLVIDGETKSGDMELGLLQDFFDCDDINLAQTTLELTAAGTLRIKLINDSDGVYYQYTGGATGEWNTEDPYWSLKDDQDGRYAYAQNRAAYFTNDEDATVKVTSEEIVAREMAVQNGKYTFELVEGNDLTINGRYYEKDGGEAVFELYHGEEMAENGSIKSDGAWLTVKGGMGAIDSTSVIGDGDTNNQLVLGGNTELSGSAKFVDVDLYLDGEATVLDLGDTTSTQLQTLRGDGTVKAGDGDYRDDAPALVITSTKAGTFNGSLLGAEGARAGDNTLVIESVENSLTQTFANVTTDSTWNIVNNGSLVFRPTDGSTLNSLTLGAQSTTVLTIDTDESQMLGLAELMVEDGAKITLNSSGAAPIMSAEDTPGKSYTVLGSFADSGSLNLGEDGEINIELGDGTAYLMVDKTQPITLKAVWNEASGYYDMVLETTVDDSNKFLPFAGGEANATAGAEMLWSKDALTHIGSEPNGDLARTFDTMAAMVTASKPDGEAINKALAAVAGSSTTVLGSAFSADVERQLKAIRNRTTTMGVGQCEVNENMPYYNAWINAEGNHRELDADGLAAGYTHDSWGGTVGFDADLTPSVTVGLALTAMYGDIETDAPDKAEGDFDTMYLSAFARYARNAWVHTFVATVGRADVSLDRTVNVNGSVYETTGETDGMAFGFMYEVGRVFAVSEDGSTCWQPVFNVALRSSSISGYEEEGSDAGLSVGDQDFTTITFGVGARVQSVIGENLYNRASIFEARALVKVDAGDTEAEASNALLNGDGTAYTIEGAEAGAVGIEIGAGVTIPMGADGGAIFVDASADLRSGYTNINGTVGYRVNF